MKRRLVILAGTMVACTASAQMPKLYDVSWYSAGREHGACTAERGGMRPGSRPGARPSAAKYTGPADSPRADARN